MTKIVPTETFDGYPDNRTRTRYQKGVEASVPDAYAKLLFAKGLADRPKAEKKTPDEE